MSTDTVTGWVARWIGMKGKTPNSPERPHDTEAERYLKVDDHRQVRRSATVNIGPSACTRPMLDGHRVSIINQTGRRPHDRTPCRRAGRITTPRVDYMTYNIRDLVPTRGPHVAFGRRSWATAGTTAVSPTAAPTTRRRATPSQCKAKPVDPVHDGAAQTVVTGTRRAAGGPPTPGPSRADDIYDGQTYDARQGAAGLDLARLRRHALVRTCETHRLRRPGSRTRACSPIRARPRGSMPSWDRRPRSITVATGVTGQDGSPNGRGRIVVDPARTVTDPAAGRHRPGHDRHRRHRRLRPRPEHGRRGPLQPCAARPAPRSSSGSARCSTTSSAGADGPEGSVYRANLRTAKATSTYILKGDPTGRDPSGLPDLLRLPLCVRHRDGHRHDHRADRARSPRPRSATSAPSTTNDPRRQPADQQHPVGAARQLPVGAHRLPAARRTPRLDG